LVGESVSPVIVLQNLGLCRSSARFELLAGLVGSARAALEADVTGCRRRGQLRATKRHRTLGLIQVSPPIGTGGFFSLWNSHVCCLFEDFHTVILSHQKC